MADTKQKTLEMERTVKTWTAELSPGEFLHINSTEDGDGTWFDTTQNLFDAYWNDHDQIENICETEFFDFVKEIWDAEIASVGAFPGWDGKCDSSRCRELIGEIAQESR